MTAEIVNLRRVRKAAARTDREAQAAGNRMRHGRTRGERDALALENGRATRLLDGARLDGAVPAADGG